MKSRVLVAALILTLPMASSPTSTKAVSTKPSKPDKLFQKSLNKNDQILHALDRLTFGPSPGDVEHVKKIGLKQWIDQQLHPERIKENFALEAQLLPLESLRMT